MQKELNTQKIELIHPESSEQKYPYIGDIQAGFPSPAEDFFHDYISLDELLIDQKESTFFCPGDRQFHEQRFQRGGGSVDHRQKFGVGGKQNRSLFYQWGIHSETHQSERWKMFPDPIEPGFPHIEVNFEHGVIIWGIVKYSIRKH